MAPNRRSGSVTVHKYGSLAFPSFGAISAISEHPLGALIVRVLACQAGGLREPAHGLPKPCWWFAITPLATGFVFPQVGQRPSVPPEAAGAVAFTALTGAFADPATRSSRWRRISSILLMAAA